jgi:hypothetical protein
MPEEDVSVTTVADPFDRPRKLSEYKPTNLPLSADEIARDEARDTAHEGWAPRTTENIGDLVPLPERAKPSRDRE